jgi:hypothetical protein
VLAGLEVGHHDNGQGFGHQGRDLWQPDANTWKRLTPVFGIDVLRHGPRAGASLATLR